VMKETAARRNVLAAVPRPPIPLFVK